jgi:hypothetical protein
MWLGKEADNSHLAMSMIETWGKTRMRKVILEATETSKVAAAVLENIKDPFNKPSWTAMRYFFERPYWRRIWIVQEVVLSRDAVLICGEIELKFLYLYAAANSWTDLALLTNETSTLIKYDQHFMIKGVGLAAIAELLVLKTGERKYKEQNITFVSELHNLLWYTSTQLATDARDKVYGVLGLIDGDHGGFRPDYNRNIVQVYTDVAVMYIQATRKLSSICSRSSFEPNIKEIPAVLGLPSWVPDLTNQRYIKTDLSAAADTAAEFAFSESFQCLTARGIIADEITELIHANGSLEALPDLLQAWVKFAATYAQPFHPTGIPWRQALFRTLVAETRCYGYGESDFKKEARALFYQKVMGFILSMWRVLGETDKAKAIGHNFDDRRLERLEEVYRDNELDFFAKLFLCWTTENPDTKIQAYTNALLEEFCGHPGTIGHIEPSMLKYTDEIRDRRADLIFRFCSRLRIRVCSYYFTPHGYMGLAPLKARKGDLVCVLLGCEIPLIIRRDGDHYLVIGESYIYGMMNGEVIQDVRDGKRQLQDFKFN